MSSTELAALVCCDLGAIVRGRSVPSDTLSGDGGSSVGWVPANLALTPIGTLAEPNPFGSTGDLRLKPDFDAHVRVELGYEEIGVGDGFERIGGRERSPLELVLCDIVETDGSAWECCPRSFLRAALSELEATLGLQTVASFEHEFQLLLDAPPALAFSLEAQRRAEPFPSLVFDALRRAGVAPERFMPEYASHQFEIPVEPAAGLAAADRAVVLREVVREVARALGTRASFSPLLDPSEAGNGVHIHLSLLDADGYNPLYDAARPAGLSELGARFAAGVLEHAAALSALTAPSPVSAARLRPHRWSAGAVCLAQQNREALLRVPPLVTSAGAGAPATQLRLEYRGADASANPYLALGAIVRAGLDGVRRELPAPALLDRDPALLGEVDAARFGVGALPASLAASLDALAFNETAREWLSPLLYEAYVAVKRAELDAAGGVELDKLCKRYAAIY
ncbi:MAG TPA: glutamine synthetase family protein [Solirubrobacteraceae bacterium]|jgi:glutamine synthetase|nr:glutamine synthetase family protein [Solirubrobacteraceae bacterium]